MKFWMIVAALGLFGFATALRAADEKPANPEDAKLEAAFKTYLEESFKAEPLKATRLGDHRFDDKLDDISAEARAANLKRDKNMLAQLPKTIDVSRLSRPGQIDFEIFQHELERSIWMTENFDSFADDPRIYGDYLTESVYLLLTQSTLPKDTNVKNALARMALVPKIVEVARKTIKNPPKVKLETAIRQTKGAIGFYTDDIYTLTGLPKTDKVLSERAGAIVKALESHQAFLETDVLPRATENWRIGREKFEKKFALDLDAGITPDEAYAEAQAEATQVEAEMAMLARLLWATTFPSEAIPPDDAEGRRAMTAKVLARIGEDHSTPESLVSDARATVEDIKTFITAKKILALPEPDRLAVIEMPEFMRGNSTAYLNPAPPLDPNGRSEYAISPPPADWPADRVTSLLQEYNHAMLKILTIHEAYPGHYVQLEYSNRYPSLIRRVLGSGTFAEGWAVYTERMMLDQGFGAGDAKLRLQQLKFYLRAVCNTILDHEMHVGTMTDDQAMALLVGRAFQTEGEAFGKVIRSKQSSCQLSTYFVGRTAFNRLRLSVQRQQGDHFNLGDFHEATLSHGTLPVKYLPELVGKALK
jgi:uncharacterized protein (DUF885 family)